jgi:hypothetical protein
MFTTQQAASAKSNKPLATDEAHVQDDADTLSLLLMTCIRRNPESFATMESLFK